MDWINFLKIMLVDERCAIAKYKQAAANAKDADLKKMFTEMMGEEVVHVQIIEGKIEQIKKKTKSIGKKK